MVEATTKFTFTHDESDQHKDKYGVLPFINSSTDPNNRYQTKWTCFIDISEELVGKVIKCRCRIQRTRGKGKSAFLVLRDILDTAQGVLFTGDEVSPQMIKFICSIPHESLVDVEALVTKVDKPIESCTISNYELQIKKFFLVVPCVNVLPFQIEDANRKTQKGMEDEPEKAQEKPQETTEEKKDEKKDKKDKKEKKDKDKDKKEKVEIIVKSDTRFDNRVLDLRVAATQSMMRLQSAVGQLYREYLYKENFIEIHSPKLIGGASEGGTNVFKLKYFDREACLAQSPQLYKQMSVIGGIEKVFEIAPVFRAENSNTSRHLCEFTMLDLEMTFKEHYFEITDTINKLFVHIFNGLKTRFKHELNIVANQYPFELIEYPEELVKLSFHEGVALLKENGIEQDINEDLDTVNERILGELVKKKYGTDFYLLHRYPKSARPFYTMPDPQDPNFTNSYDAFIRGEEILSGAQRIHDYDMLYQKVVEKGINPETLKDYINAFKLGAPPHGGAGIGLERVVKLFIGFGNVKRCCLFPRDPSRLSP